MSGAESRPLAAIFGCAGPRLSESERSFFRATSPLGFILFKRNIEDPAQVVGLVAELKDCTERNNVLVLIDQEGGRVARLRPPHWRESPCGEVFGSLFARTPESGRRAARLNSRLIADDLQRLGINVDCLPVLDLRFREGHDIIGDRAYSDDPEEVAAIGRAACEGLLEGGVLPVVKHVPGHGRARSDSHLELPVVDASVETLAATDFEPFRKLNDMPLAMTAHILYTALDDRRPTTVSATVIDQIIRHRIGFDGLLMTDDLSMKALGGTIAERARDSLMAGCDIVLHCNGDMVEMKEIASAVQALDDSGARRLARASEMLHPPAPFDRDGVLAELNALLADRAIS